MLHSNDTGKPVEKLEQISQLPKALCDERVQHKGDKANSTIALRLRYKDIPHAVFTSQLQCYPMYIVIEEMSSSTQTP